MADHLPQRPSWQCLDEPAVPWPCQVFKRRIWIQFPQDRQGLAAHMGQWLRPAREQLPDVSEAELHQRFIGWIDQWPGDERKRDGVRGNAGRWTGSGDHNDGDHDGPEKFQGEPGE